MRRRTKRHNCGSVPLRRAITLCIVSVVMAVIMPKAFGAAITIYSTGYGLEPGDQDPNYTLTVNALNNGTATFVAEGAPVAELASTGAPQTGWPLNGTWATDPNASWIAPQANVVAIAGTGADTQYLYTTTFDLAGLDPTTAQLSGYWTADNYIAQVQLNGQTVFSSNSCMSPSPQTGYFFQGLYPFDIGSGFQSGENTLSFSVTNSNCYNTQPMTNPTGLFVDISGTADSLSEPLGEVVPEPGTLFSVALLLGLVLCIYRAKAQAISHVQTKHRG